MLYGISSRCAPQGPKRRYFGPPGGAAALFSSLGRRVFQPSQIQDLVQKIFKKMDTDLNLKLVNFIDILGETRRYKPKLGDYKFI